MSGAAEQLSARARAALRHTGGGVEKRHGAARRRSGAGVDADKWAHDLFQDDDGREPPAAPDLRSQLRGGRARDAPAGTLLRTRVTDARVVGDLRAKLQPPRAPQPPSLPEFLAALGLERYAPLFEAEEVNMAALALCSDEDMRALGVPLGPRRLIRSMLPQ